MSKCFIADEERILVRTHKTCDAAGTRFAVIVKIAAVARASRIAMIRLSARGLAARFQGKKTVDLLKTGLVKNIPNELFFTATLSLINCNTEDS
jgi:hypothetical protein